MVVILYDYSVDKRVAVTNRAQSFIRGVEARQGQVFRKMRKQGMKIVSATPVKVKLRGDAINTALSHGVYARKGMKYVFAPME